MEAKVIKPREMEKAEIAKSVASGQQRYPVHYEYHQELFGVRQKMFYPLDKAKSLLQDTIPTLSHESDGLIFQASCNVTCPFCCNGIAYSAMCSACHGFHSLDKAKSLLQQDTIATLSHQSDSLHLQGELRSCLPESCCGVLVLLYLCAWHDSQAFPPWHLLPKFIPASCPCCLPFTAA